MRARYFRTLAGQWIEATITTEDEIFTTTLAQHIADVSAGWGVQVECTETAGADPRTGTLLTKAVPPHVPTADEVDATNLQTLNGTDPATWTNTQLKDGLIRLIRIQLRERGLLT